MFSFFNFSNVMFDGFNEQCPQCGGSAELQSGTYDFVGGVMTAFRAPGMSRAQVFAIADIVSKAAQGKISPEVALQEAERVNSGLAALIKAACERHITFDRILGVILLIQTFWNQQSSDVAAQIALAEERTQTELLQQMHEALNSPPERSLRPKTTRAKTTPPQSKTIGTKNRHDRRKETAIQRRARATSEGIPKPDGN